MLRSSTETDAGDKGGNKTDEISVFLVATDRCAHGGAQPRNKAEKKLWHYVLWWELWSGQRAGERGNDCEGVGLWVWGRVRGTLVCGWRCLCSHISSKTCKAKQLCQECSPDSMQNKTTVASGRQEDQWKELMDFQRTERRMHVLFYVGF